MKSTLYLFIGISVPLLLLVGACSSVEEAGLEPEASQPATRLLSQDRAITAAIGHASHLIRDGEIRQTGAESLTYGDASARIPGATRPQPIPADKPVWIITLKGLFYEPAGPPPLPGESSNSVTVPTCGVIRVLIDDSTGDYIRLTYESASDC
jgi:hypothetical protein